MLAKEHWYHSCIVYSCLCSLVTLLYIYFTLLMIQRIDRNGFVFYYYLCFLNSHSVEGGEIACMLDAN